MMTATVAQPGSKSGGKVIRITDRWKGVIRLVSPIGGFILLD